MVHSRLAFLTAEELIEVTFVAALARGVAFLDPPPVKNLTGIPLDFFEGSNFGLEVVAGSFVFTLPSAE
jgi:hypothetical protein